MASTKSIATTNHIKLVKARAKLKRNKPKFVRPESWRYKRLDPRWRKPKGKDNKVRLSRKGWPKSAKIGYGSLRAARGLHPSGLWEIVVYNIYDLEPLNKNIHAVRIAHTVGSRKRKSIIEEAEKRELRVLNPGKKEEKSETV